MKPRAHLRLLAVVVALLALLSSVSSIRAATPPAAPSAQLGIRPVGVEGNYFDLEMEPGETRQLTVELGNHGTEPVTARTYPADVYTIPNGGFGARLAGEPVSGTTTWLSYLDETFEIPAGNGLLRTFTVSVPQDAAPGEYVTSVAIQNAEPVSSDNEGIAFKQVNRQVIAVAIRVPGPVSAGLAIGSIEHKTLGRGSLLAIEVRNTGNVRLTPAGDLILRNEQGTEIGRYPVVMDSFYAWTETVVEVPIATLLEPGSYAASLSLADDTYNLETVANALAVSVPEIELPAVVIENATQPASIDQQAQPVPSAVDAAEPSMTVLIAAAIGGALAVAIVVGGLCIAWPIVRRRQQHRRPTVSPQLLGAQPASVGPSEAGHD